MFAFTSEVQGGVWCLQDIEALDAVSGVSLRRALPQLAWEMLTVLILRSEVGFQIVAAAK